MRNHRRLIMSGVAALAASVLLLTGCSASGQASGDKAAPKRIFVFASQPTGFNDATKRWNEGWMEAAKELGSSVDVTVKAMGSLELEPAPYLNFINQALAEKPDGIVIVPNNAVGMRAGIQRIVDSGVPVVIMDQDVPDLKGDVAWVGTAGADAGAAAGKWMVDQKRAGKLQSDTIAVFTGPPGATTLDERAAGFLNETKPAGLNVVATSRGGCADTPKSRADMSDYLTAHPDLGGVFSTCDGAALGVAAALQAAGKEQQVRHVSIDGQKEAVALIKPKKGLEADYAQPFVEVGKAAVLALAHDLQGQKVDKRIVEKVSLVDAGNADKYLATFTQ